MSHDHECSCGHGHNTDHECECGHHHESIEIEDALANLIENAVSKAIEGFEKEGQLVPFTMLVIDDLVNLETHPGESTESVESATKAISASTSASMYAFCYDGYVGSEDGDLDAIIIEAGMRGQDYAIAACNLYSTEHDALSFNEEINFLSEIDNLLSE